jgi:hypothetical protein
MQSPAVAAPLDAPPAVRRAYQWIAKGDMFLNELQQAEPAYEAFRRAWEDILAAGSAEDRRKLYATLRTVAGYVMHPRPLPPGSGDRIFAAERAAWIVPADAPLPRPSPARPLHVAYMSPDLNRNAVGLFVWPLLALPDPARFRVTVYYTRAQREAAVSDAVTCWLRRTAAALPHVRWRDVGHLADEPLAQRVRADGVDVLVDLLGAGVGNRLGVLARRPAPRIVNYLGFPDTVDLAAVTHRITDGLVDPEGEPGREPGEPREPGEETTEVHTGATFPAASRASAKRQRNRARRRMNGPRGEAEAGMNGPRGEAEGGRQRAAHQALATAASGERLVRLPTRCFVCYAHWEDVWRCPPIVPRAPPDFGLGPAKLRLGVSARPLKHHPRMIRLWREVLSRRPDMQLVVKDDVAGKVRLAELYADFPPDQVDLAPAPSFHPAFMEGFNELDLMLDPQPYSGTTMTCAGLYMGVPALSLYDPHGRHVSNVSAAILRHTDRELAALQAEGELQAGEVPAGELPAGEPASEARPLSLEAFIVPSLEAYADRMAALGREELETWRRARPLVARAFRRAMDARKFMTEFQDALSGIAAGEL